MAPVFMLLPTAYPTQIPTTSMPLTPPDESDFIHSEQFLQGLMKRQLKLSISCASAFLLLLLGLPLLNYFAPEMMATRIGGFTLSWLVLGVLFFPYVWIIARLFITRSMALEAAEVRLAADENKRSS
jgi:uncharacterized membrane protein (DUF485 family)